MAANVAVTNTFVNGTSADAPQVNTNFGDLVTWINTNATHLDGSKAFTGVPSCAIDPSAANHLVRKGYLDAAVPQATFKEVVLRRVAAQAYIIGGTGTISWDTEDADVSGFITAPGTTLTVPAGCAGLYALGWAFTTTGTGFRLDMQLTVNNSFSPLANFSTTTKCRGGMVAYLEVGDTISLGYDNSLGNSTGNLTGRLHVVRLAD